MSIPASLLPTTCDIYRPFGDATPLATAVPCKLVPDIDRGRGSGLAGTLLWTHYVDLDESVDVLDGGARTGGTDTISYADGDELRIPSGGSTRYVVVWVETRQLGTSQAFKRVYLLRDTA